MRAVTTLLLAHGGEGRNYLILARAGEGRISPIHFPISDLMLLLFSKVEETGRNSEKTVQESKQ